MHGDWEFLRDSAAFDDWLAPLENITWVAYIEAPPNEHCQPEQVAKYLARYLTGGPISDRRLVSDEDGFVTILARVGDKTGGSNETIPIRMPGAEFVRRWSLHILPKGYTKTRRFGGYSNHHRERYMAECRELLGAAPSSPVDAVGDVITPAACESDSDDAYDRRTISGHESPQCDTQRDDHSEKNDSTIDVHVAVVLLTEVKGTTSKGNWIISPVACPVSSPAIRDFFVVESVSTSDSLARDAAVVV